IVTCTSQDVSLQLVIRIGRYQNLTICKKFKKKKVFSAFKLILFIFCFVPLVIFEEPCSSCQCCPSGTDCITTNIVVQCIDPCATYTVVNDAWRSTENTDYSVLHCDQNIVWSGWYRFYLGQTSAQMPEKCVAERRCGTDVPLWITEPHPVQLNEIVNRTVCNAWLGSCCFFPTHTIQIKLCSGYYVYKLQQPSVCHLAYCAELPFRALAENESSITLQWNKINSSTSFVLQFNGIETNISSPDGDGPVNHTVSSLTAGTKYTFTLFHVFENVRNSGVQLTAVTATQNAGGFTKSGQNESSITLQWNKISNNISFVLQFNGTETNIRVPDGDGPVIHTVSSLIPRTKYTFTLFSVLENIRSSGVSITAATATQNAGGFTKSGQNESSITLQWNKISNNISFVLQFNGTETNIRVPDGDGPVIHTVSSLIPRTKYTFTLFSVLENIRSSGVSITAATAYTVSSLTAGTKYTFTLFSVFEGIRSSGVQLVAFLAPQNAEGFTKSGQYKSSITLQWNKINNSTSFVLQFNSTETNINAPDGDGPVTHTVSSLTPGTKYTFTLFSVFESIRSSGVQLIAFLEPSYVSRMKVQLTSQRKLSESEMQKVLEEYLRGNGLSQFSMKIRIIKP
ncbi:receptor-type tyrosine-protein phosphatase H-like, partial [Poecilia formosa]|uniref:receptor-type tyrosine-protein phosphatase H-like n=1 Tax=Poecilia formosa TaxID=48698 RepID=UPI0007B9D07A